MKKFFNFLKRINGKIKVKGKNNCFDANFIANNKVYLRIEGNNNQIITGNTSKKSELSIQIYGDNNKIIIGDNYKVNGMIDIGFKWHNKVNNAIIKIGTNAHINAASIVILEPNSQITIGENCLFASEIDIWASDTHSIIDLEGNLLNYGGKIEIGNHVWVGKGVKISKYTKIADNSIVGWSSVVSGKFEDPNVIIAGNPAKIVKQNINWHELSPHNYKTANQNYVDLESDK